MKKLSILGVFVFLVFISFSCQNDDEVQAMEETAEVIPEFSTRKYIGLPSDCPRQSIIGTWITKELTKVYNNCQAVALPDCKGGGLEQIGFRELTLFTFACEADIYTESYNQARQDNYVTQIRDFFATQIVDFPYSIHEQVSFYIKTIDFGTFQRKYLVAGIRFYKCGKGGLSVEGDDVLGGPRGK